MAIATFYMRAIVLEQKERTRKSSKADVERFIEESKSKIVFLESQISALIELRDREHACIAALRHLISPIHTLPVELLAEIFQLTIRDYMSKDVFRISHVCSDWRQVAHSTPRLWTKPIQIYIRPSRSDHVYMDGLKAWLVRSAPLTIPVSMMLEHGRKDHRIPDEVLVLKTAPRWHSLDLTRVHPAGGHTPSSLIGQLAECSLESLEELTLGSFAENINPTSFTAVPRIWKLCIHFCSNAPLPILVPWAQLTNPTLRADFPDIALDVLGQCPNLIRVAISTAGWNVLPEPRQDILPLSRLHFLSLSFFGSGGHVTPFLDRLSTPALENLYLNFRDMDMGRRWTQAHVTAFQLRAPNMTQLDLWYSSLTSDDLRTIIRHAPSLTHLELTYCRACFDDALIDALSYKAGVSPLAPHLHNLYLDDMGDHFTPDILGGMIASRWWTDAELASRLIPPAVARWTRIDLWGHDFAEHILDIMKNLSSDVPIIHG
ncbi:hypothetical protein B0H12DRAFT_1229746 [Mycena haematopus]|nr:hypothetical protein B0H12DRAFT_1229746 [Mycena haematopus]